MPPWLALIPLVLAQEPTDLERAWYLAQSSRPEEALAVALGAIERDPGDIAAHRLHVWLRVRGFRDADGAEAVYRAWLAEEPGSDAARVALACALRWRHDRPGPWCGEVEDLLAELPAALLDLYWSERALYEAREVCGGDRAALQTDLVRLGMALAEARGYALRRRVVAGPVDDALAHDLRAFYAEQPWSLAVPGDLWRSAAGPALDQARLDALAAARDSATSAEPLAVEAAMQVFGRAGEADARADAEERLLVLDPGYRPNRFAMVPGVQWIARPEDGEDPLLAEIRARCAGARPREALGLAEAYGERVPTAGPVRAAYEGFLAGLHADLHQPTRAMEAWRRAWLADPADPEVANAFAWAAATLGAHLDEALAAIEGAALRLPAWDPRGDHPASGYDAWLDQQRVLAGAIADTHGWVLYTLDRYEEAAGVLRHAVLLAGDEPEIRLHLGLCYEKLGNDAEALRELGRGLALTEDADGELERLARKRLEDLFPSRAWARGGLDAWIALQEPPARPAGTATDAPERIGQPFPDLEFQVGGEPKKLSDYAGIRVVDLWATWCGPCLRALPVVDRVAKDYAGRATVIAVSVDEERADAEGFYADQPAGAVVRAWAGPSALRRAGVQGIPSLFVIDSAGLVRAVRLGWGDDRDGRRRLAADLERALGE